MLGSWVRVPAGSQAVTGFFRPVFFVMMYRYITLIVCFMSLSLRLQAQQSDEQLAAYYYDHNEFAQAAQLYGNLYGHTDNVYYYQRLLQSYLELGDYKAALKLVERRIKIHPRELSLYVDEGTVFKRQGQERKAEKCYERAISSVSADLQPVQDLAQAFINAKLHGQAVKVYLAARTQTNNTYLYFNELVGVYMQMGDYTADFAAGTDNSYELLVIRRAPNTATGVDEIDSKNGNNGTIFVEKMIVNGTPNRAS